MRFRQRFMERDGQPCEGGIICGGGHDITYNSGLLLHLVTDELSWVLGADDLRGASRQRLLWSLAVPLVVTPLIFGLIALALMATIHALATVISRFSSGFLNGITNSEVKRAGFGNDTEGEVVTGRRQADVARSLATATAGCARRSRHRLQQRRRQPVDRQVPSRDRPGEVCGSAAHCGYGDQHIFHLERVGARVIL